MAFDIAQLNTARTIDGTISSAIQASALIPNAATVVVRNSAGSDNHNATALVTGNSLTSVDLAATVAMVDNSDTVNVENSAGNFDSTGTVTVSAGAVVNVRLGSTKAILTNAVAVTGVTVTGSGTTATPTITNGVLTAIVLS